MRPPKGAHDSRPWRIHEVAPDFRLEDVWALPTPGGPADFPRLVEDFASGAPADGGSVVIQLLFSIRWRLGEAFGWDRPEAGLGTRVPTLRERLPDDLRGSASSVDLAALPFVPLFLTADEFAAETANRTVHGILHLGWVPDGTGGHRGQMAVLVRPNAWLGTAYMTAIRPIRQLLVYPELVRRIEQRWQRRGGPGPRSAVAALSAASPPGTGDQGHVDLDQLHVASERGVHSRRHAATSASWVRTNRPAAPMASSAMSNIP